MNYIKFITVLLISLMNIITCNGITNNIHAIDSENNIINNKNLRNSNIKHDVYESINDDETTPTIITNYVGNWYPLYLNEKMYIYAGYGKMINTENKYLSSKKAERMIGYGYLKNKKTNLYTVYFESIPHDGSYWHLEIYNVTDGYYKYTILNDYSGGIWVYGDNSIKQKKA